MIYRNCPNCNFANMPMSGSDCQRCGESLHVAPTPGIAVQNPSPGNPGFPLAEIGMIIVAICAILAAWIVPKRDFFSWIVVLVIVAACIALFASAVRSMRKGKKPRTAAATPSASPSRMTNVSARLSDWQKSAKTQWKKYQTQLLLVTSIAAVAIAELVFPDFTPAVLLFFSVPLGFLSAWTFKKFRNAKSFIGRGAYGGLCCFFVMLVILGIAAYLA